MNASLVGEPNESMSNEDEHWHIKYIVDIEKRFCEISVDTFPRLLDALNRAAVLNALTDIRHADDGTFPFFPLRCEGTYCECTVGDLYNKYRFKPKALDYSVQQAASS